MAPFVEFDLAVIIHSTTESVRLYGTPVSIGGKTPNMLTVRSGRQTVSCRGLAVPGARNTHRHEYSSAPKYALGAVNVRLDSTFVTVLDDDYHHIVTHRRLYGNDYQSSMEWVPYLEYISRHPRSLKNTGIYAMMPDAMQSYLNNCNGSQKKDVLHML